MKHLSYIKRSDINSLLRKLIKNVCTLCFETTHNILKKSSKNYLNNQYCKYGFKLAILIFVVVISGLQLQGCAVAAVSGAATGVAMATDRRTAGTIVDDKAIEIKALHALSRDSNLWKKSHFNVVSYNNDVLLLGQTPNPQLRQQAEDALRDIPKIKRIYNELTIKEPISLGDRSKDTWITTQVKAKMIGTREINPTRVKVVTEDGVVYLMGITKQKEQMSSTDIAREVNGVNKVVQIFETAS